MVSLGWLGVMADIAGVTSMLVGADAGWISGHIVRANGGAI